ncbi:MAG: Cys-tRNA(Pro) deacylase [Anaerovoracaceae bacterium]|jgi:Cys-tRNA(Pro)/Cys-tRNA(Cys) deacylase
MSKKQKAVKTNAIRIVESNGIAYEEKTYDASGGFVDGITAAAKTGTEPERCFKTLVLIGHSGENVVCVIPVAEELDLKKAAKVFHEKNVEMIHVRDITKTTGYIKGGCSPIGMKKLFPTAIDETALLFDRIAVSGGKIGLQIELDPNELAGLVNAVFADLTR